MILDVEMGVGTDVVSIGGRNVEIFNASGGIVDCLPCSIKHSDMI